jgi:hypothetical protein
MIWHIFKKDLRITWPLAVLVGALHWVVPLLALFGGFLPGGLRALNVLRLLVVTGPLASGFLITAAVHLDAIPGVRQDWLVRPIRRRDLILAKLLFAALVVQVPILLASMTAFLIGGFPVMSAFSSSAEHSLVQMCVINVPFIALASMTSNFLELLSGGVVLGLAEAAFEVLTSNAQWSVEPIFRSGLGWILYLIASAVVFSGALLIIRLQYFSRRTMVSWFVSAGITIAFLLTWSVPWRFIFAIQMSLSKNEGSSQPVELRFDPEAGRFHRPAGALTSEDALAIARRDAAAAGTVPIYLPLRVQGLPPDSAIQMDHSEVRITENGHVNRLEQEPWNTRREGTGSSSNLVYPAVTIPAPIYERIKDQPARVEVDYWLTLAQVEISETLPAIGGDQTIPNGGRCRTRINDQQTAVQYACTYSGPPAPCFHSFLEYMPGNQRNPDRFGCGQYASLAGALMNPLFAARLVPSGIVLPFRDPAGLAHFPVDGSKLPESRAVLQLYRVRDHFIRKLVIPDIRLRDWEAETPLV